MNESPCPSEFLLTSSFSLPQTVDSLFFSSKMAEYDLTQVSRR
jgi:hypothetical protein